MYYTISIFDNLLNENVIRELSDEEIKLLESERFEGLQNLAKSEEKNAARKAIFDKLGITEDEAKLLLS